MQARYEVLEIFACICIIYLTIPTVWESIQRRIEAYYDRAYAAIPAGRLGMALDHVGH